MNHYTVRYITWEGDTLEMYVEAKTKLEAQKIVMKEPEARRIDAVWLDT